MVRFMCASVVLVSIALVMGGCTSTISAAPEKMIREEQNGPARAAPPQLTKPSELQYSTTSAWETMTRTSSGELLRQQAEPCTNVVTDLQTAEAMATLLTNARHFDILSASFSGDPRQFAQVEYAPGCHHVSDIETALVMSTGLASLAAVPFNEVEFSSTEFGGAAQSSQMVTDITDTIYGKAPTLDCAILNFTVRAKRSAQLEFEYRFASEEYNEYVGIGFVDAFGLFVNGVNYATLMDGSPLTIDQVNLNKNAEQFVDHPPMAAYDGYTTLLSTVGLDVEEGDVLEFSLQICDAWDPWWDSALMIVANSIDLCSGVTEIACEKSTVVGECKNGAATVDVGTATAETCDEFLPVERVDAFFPTNVFPLGNSTATYKATDPETGDSATCAVKVVVQDTQPPVLQCFVEQVVAECTGAVTTVDLPCATARDACEGPVPAVRTDEFALSNAFALGDSVVVYEASDSKGLSSTCEIMVKVVDTLAPVISVFRAADDTILVGDEAIFEVSVADACSGVSWVIDYGDGVQGTALKHEYDAIGTYTAVLTAMDEAGNLATATLVVNVQGGCGHSSGEGVVRSPLGSIVNAPEECSFGAFKFVAGKRLEDGNFYGTFEYRVLYSSLRFKSYLIISADFGDDGSLVIVGEGSIGDRRQYQFVAEFEEGGRSVDKMRMRLFDIRNEMALVYDSLPGEDLGELAWLEQGGYKSVVKQCETKDDDDDLPICKPAPAPESDSSSSSSESESDSDHGGNHGRGERERERRGREREREREQHEREREREGREREREERSRDRDNGRGNRHAQRPNNRPC
ncbi:hypothetical protein FVE85_8697 [Porphyridium purpureum]|uniref:HYR domain-containing protein n=1 Tax=Porphyridium purpureum TaxID=35688 RepID=A0A5J4YR26_PORPP|nr:hypothetical protein FVE85_8697 [Porphyridium purpureum]|eukprot:POR2298..scf296_7